MQRLLCEAPSMPLRCRFVVGQPLPAPKLAQEGEPSREEVEAFHACFYGALEKLWEAHAKDFPCYQDVKLVICHST